MGVRERRGVQSGRDQAGEMRHVDHEVGADRIRDLAEALEVPMAGIGRTAGDDQLGLVLLGGRLERVHVDAVVVLGDAVGDRLEPLAGDVDLRAVGEMAAGGEVEAHERVARLQQRKEDALVGLAAGIRLHVGEADAEQLLGALDRERLGDVDELAAAVVAATRIAFGVFVGEDRTLRLHHGARDDVLRGDQLDLVTLTAELLLDGFRHLGVGGRQVSLEERRRIAPAGIGLGHGEPLGRNWKPVNPGLRCLFRSNPSLACGRKTGKAA